MSEFVYHTKASAPEASQQWIPEGFLPNLHAIMAESPFLLEGYKRLWDLALGSSLSPLEVQVVMMTANFENNCHYCVPWHTFIMKQGKMPDGVIDALRSGEPLPDAKLDVLRTFTRLLIENRGHAGDDALAALIDAGYSEQNALDVVLCLAVKLMSNYTNAITHTRLDDPPKAFEWTKPGA
ncbi:MAG: carboxymuconolactone decarboxylase family protein [Phycisphaerales bacterium]|jgi:alkylhydroperoxidase family enzyme